MAKRNWGNPVPGLVVGSLFIWGFSQIPVAGLQIAFDWKLFHQATHNFRLDYSGIPLFNPPWTLVLLWPITMWPLQFSFALAAFASIVVFQLSVPRRPQRWVWATSSLILLLSYPFVRLIYDGNLEAMVVGGALLAVTGSRARSWPMLAAGTLLLTVKVQETWLVLLILSISIWRHLPKRQIAALALTILAFVVPILFWRGAEWLQALQAYPVQDFLTNNSLFAVLSRIGFPDPVIWILWIALLALTVWGLRFSRSEVSIENVGFLLAAGLLLSQYAGNISMVTPFALGVIPFFQRSRVLGLVLIFLYFIPYGLAVNPEIRLAWENIYWACVLFFTWAVLLADLRLRNA